MMVKCEGTISARLWEANPDLFNENLLLEFESLFVGVHSSCGTHRRLSMWDVGQAPDPDSPPFE